MPRKIKNENFACREQKALWHPVGLQRLSPRRFINVANNILAGQYNLLDFKLRREDNDFIIHQRRGDGILAGLNN